MTAADMQFAATRAQQLTGKANAVVAFIVPGVFPGVGRLMRLAGKRGPMGTVRYRGRNRN